MTDPRIAAEGDEARAGVRVVLDFFATALDGDRDLGAVDRLVAPDFVDHAADTGDPGRSGVAAKLAWLWTELPDGRYVPEQIVAAGELVSVRSTLQAHGRAVDVADLYRVSDGLIREHWHVVDTAAFAELIAGA